MEKAFSKSVAAVTSVLLFIHVTTGDYSSQVIDFTKGTACKLQERLDLDLATLKTDGDFSRLLVCAAACVDECRGVSMGEDHSCYHHVVWPEKFMCDSKDTFFQMYYKNHCEHNGVWDPGRLKCKCVNGWVGVRCERHPRSCKEMTTFEYEDDFHKETILRLKNYPESFLVYCSYYKDKNEFYTYILYNNGKRDNTMTWDDYVKGFFHDSSNYWIGLEKMKALNDAGQTVVYLRALLDIGGSDTYEYYSYKNFRMGTASTGYNFTAVVNSYHTDGGNYGDCLTPVVGVPFSTADHGGDVEQAKCARDGKAGWWFKTCDVGCNPLGPKTYWRLTGLNLNKGVTNIYMYFKNV